MWLGLVACVWELNEKVEFGLRFNFAGVVNVDSNGRGNGWLTGKRAMEGMVKEAQGKKKRVD